MKRILGIDYGGVRVGIAITDTLRITAQGLKTIVHNGNDKILLTELDKILSEYDVETIVVGMPISMNGESTQRAEITKEFIHKLKCKYNKIKIETIDERLTTVMAESIIHQNNENIKNSKKKIDSIAASIILESYLRGIK